MFFDPAEPFAPIPDALDLVVEAFDMATIFAAQQLERVDALRQEALLTGRRDGAPVMSWSAASVWSWLRLFGSPSTRRAP